MAAFAEKLCHFHHNKKTKEIMLKFVPMTTLYITETIKEWHPDVESKMPLLREKQKGKPHILKMLDELQETFLFPGSQEHFTKLIPTDSEIVLAHNDAQANNLLASLEDNTNLMLIDYEYTFWNPRAMDLANYFNETTLDNAYPLGNGMKYYP